MQANHLWNENQNLKKTMHRNVEQNTCHVRVHQIWVYAYIFYIFVLYNKESTFTNFPPIIKTYKPFCHKGKILSWRNITIKDHCLSAFTSVRKEENSGIQCAHFDFKTGSYVAQAGLRLALWIGWLLTYHPPISSRYWYYRLALRMPGWCSVENWAQDLMSTRQALKNLAKSW